MTIRSLFRVASTLALLSVCAGAQSDFVNWETPHVHPLTLTPDGTRLLAVNLPDNRLEVFDVGVGTPTPTMSIPVGLDPVSVRCRSDVEAWVVNHISDTVSIVDLTTGHVVATLDTDDEPADVVFAGSPERAFVSCSQANTVLVFDPANLATAPVRIPLLGEDPRAMGVSPAGDAVYVAIFESGNGTTLVSGGGTRNITFPPNFVNDVMSPYAGVNPPPNDGGAFDPPISGGLPAAPAVSMIVRQDAAGLWMDDNGGDWTAGVSGAQAALSGRPVGWTLLDHDVAIIDPSDNSVSYADNLMNICMALGVNPVSGEISVVGTDATNEIRFEPNVTGTFVRSHVALVDPLTPGTPSIVDLNQHLDYSTGTVAQGVRDIALAEPRGIVWNAAGDTAYVTGRGSNNIVILDALGDRAGLAPTVDVGEGPTGLALDEVNGRLYVLNQFAASISVIDTVAETELTTVPFFDPTPAAIQTGRRHLYDARETSGLGLTACAACHVDARMDRLAWDLGNPAGAMSLIAGSNLGGNIPGLTSGFQDWHPMKGPMLTQTLQDIIGLEPLHWRGDRTGIEAFNPAFVGLLGDDEMLSPTEMQEFEDFLATIFFPPNPFRNFDNSLSTSLPLPGHFTTGDFGPAGNPLPNGDATNGLALFRPPNLLDSGFFACSTCHTRPTGVGTGMTLNMGTFQPIPPGPDGEQHHALVSVDGTTQRNIKIPQLRNLYERVGLEMTQLENVAGFGFVHDGSVDSIARFLSEPAFDAANDQEVADLVAFMLSFSGDTAPTGSTTDPQEPPGPGSQSTHAAVGRQLTLSALPDGGQQVILDAMVLEADQGDVGLVAKGRRNGLPSGWSYLGAGVYQSDRTDTHTQAELLAFAGVGSELTFTVVPFGSETRIGVDRDRDGTLDGEAFLPVAAIGAMPLTGVVPLMVDFTDLSSGVVTSWSWDFGDTNMSTVQDPSHVYTAAGTYTVSLTATGPAGVDTVTEVDLVVVNEAAPIAAFSGTPLTGVAPLNVSFTDLSGGGPVTTYHWDFGDGFQSSLQNTNHTYDASGTYTVSLTVTGPGGMDTLTEIDYVVVDEPAPIAAFSGTPLTGISPLSVDFTDASTGGAISTWSWDFGDTGMSTAQNPNHVYATSGTYTVSLTVTGPGGVDTLTEIDYVVVSEPPPVAAFTGTPLTGDAPLMVSFTDASSGGQITSWSWDFGDTGTSTLQDPSHTYNAPGTYTVSLTVTGPGGVDTLTEVDYVVASDPPPIAAFTGSPLTGPAPHTVNFTDLSTGGSITSWSWDFGDGFLSVLQNPSRTYETPGTYTVSLTVTGPGGVDTATQVDYVVIGEPVPVAAFSGTPLTGDAPLQVDFTDLSTGTISSWSWDFGDTGTSALQNPSHTYNASGLYTVSLTVTGPSGIDTETLVDYVVIGEPPPVASFTATPLAGDAPLSVDFTDTSTGGLITSWSWDFGDTNSSTAQNPTHVYNTPGLYTVTLTVTGPGGMDTATEIDYVAVADPPPIASFSGTPLTGGAPLQVAFSDTSTGGSISTWDWDFGDGFLSTIQHPVHTYNNPGSYTVSLMVTGPGGVDSVTQIDYVVVVAAPVADFSGTPLIGPAPLTVDFSDLSTGSITGWSWDFDGTGSSTAQNPSHTFNLPGRYSVTLTVTGPGGMGSLTQVDLVVAERRRPFARFDDPPLDGGFRRLSQNLIFGLVESSLLARRPY